MLKNIVSLKNIKNLTKIFFRTESIFKLLYNKQEKKLNKRSIFFWSIAITSIGMGYVSYHCIDFFYTINQQTFFLNIFLLFFLYFIMFQVSMTCTNVFYFSKDVELVLPLPIKPIELLISKFNTVLISSYFLEAVFGFIPLLIYGIDTNAGLSYYFWMLLVLLIFPILPTLLISIFMMTIIKLTKFIKKKDLLQIIIVIIFSIILSNSFSLLLNHIVDFEVGADINNEKTYYSEKFFGIKYEMNQVEDKLLIINPCIKLLSDNSLSNKALNIVLIMGYNIIGFSLFVIIGKFTYMKSILNNIIYNLAKDKNKINLEGQCKQRKIWIRYIEKEFRTICRNPIYFIQSVFPPLIAIIMIFIIVINLAPGIRDFLQTEIVKSQFSDFEIDIGVIATILAGIQILFTFSNNISITAISREGNNLYIMKYMPISYFKQIFYKCIPQILLNSLLIIIIMFLIQFIDEYFPFAYLLLIFTISIILGIINSFIMILVDLKKPNLTWNSEHEIIKQNNNKVFQYVWSIIIIVFLANVSSSFNDLNIIISCLFFLIFFIVLLFIVLLIIKRKCDKIIDNL